MMSEHKDNVIQFRLKPAVEAKPRARLNERVNFEILLEARNGFGEDDFTDEECQFLRDLGNQVDEYMMASLKDFDLMADFLEALEEIKAINLNIGDDENE